MNAAIVVVGNELLSGHTRDANGPHLAHVLRELGHRVRRITIVPDDEDEIVSALKAAAGAGELVFVCGGLGPTKDDITIEAVATFVHRPLETPDEAREQVRRIYRLGKERGYLETDEVDEGAWRMARVPCGGTVVPNDQGVAPGSVHTYAGKGDEGARTVFVLPGPPGELQSVLGHMIDRKLVPAGERREVREVHLATFEAPVARRLSEVHDRFPDVEFGSYPQHGEKRVIVRFMGPPDRVDEAADALRDELGELEIAPHERGQAVEGDGPGPEPDDPPDP